ncbi:MAG: glycosyl hydrolase family protein, partial [Chitinophagaceae bacterium]
MSIDPNVIERGDFGPDFKWGVSSAAFQTEGSCDADGKGISIWDEFTRQKNAIIDGQHANIACDHYKRYREDIELIKKLGIPCYRFSISWPRIMPEGEGDINSSGILYYNDVINCCIENGIEPWITIYHWDLPLALEKRGGWRNRKVVQWFSAFTEICIIYFGDRVKHWMVMNEPMAFTGAGYFLGIHAPGKTGIRNFLPAVHHAILAAAESARTIRKIDPSLQIGITFSCALIEPYSSSRADVSAAQRADALANRLFVEPLTGKGYPFSALSFLTRIKKYMKPGDEENMCFKWDFIGIQNYTREIVQRSFFTPYLFASLVKAKNRGVPVTSMGWEVYPHAIYQMIRKFQSYIPQGKLYITENGIDDANDTKRE